MPALPEQYQKVLAAFQGDPKEMIPVLQAVQRSFGYLPEECFRIIGEFIGVSESKVYGTATFYSQFYFTPRGDEEIKVCMGTACHVRGAAKIMEFFERELKIRYGETTEDNRFSLERVNCLGACGLAPVLTVNEKVYGNADTKKTAEILKEHGGGSQ